MRLLQGVWMPARHPLICRVLPAGSVESVVVNSRCSFVATDGTDDTDLNRSLNTHGEFFVSELDLVAAPGPRFAGPIWKESKYLNPMDAKLWIAGTFVSLTGIRWLAWSLLAA
jgi:hypothetical protein